MTSPKGEIDQKDTSIADNVSSSSSSSNLSYKCVMVTGGVGFVGSHITEALLSQGHKVVIYDIFNSETSKSQEKQRNASVLRQAARKFKNKGASLHIVVGDIRDQPSIIRTIKEHNVNACIHTGGMVDDRRSVKHPEEYIDVNIRGTALLLDALGKCGVKKVIQASTRSVFGQRTDNDERLDENASRRPINPYGASKVGADAMAHCYCFLHDMDVTIIRIFATYGPRGRPDMMPRILIESIVGNKPIRKFGDGSATRTWIYISDIVSAFMMALNNNNNNNTCGGGGFKEYNTGSEESTTLNELIECAESVCGKKAIIEHHKVPPGDANKVGHSNYDRIQRELNWRPKVNILEGMRQLYTYYVAHLDDEDAINAFWNTRANSIKRN